MEWILSPYGSSSDIPCLQEVPENWCYLIGKYVFLHQILLSIVYQNWILKITTTLCCKWWEVSTLPSETLLNLTDDRCVGDLLSGNLGLKIPLCFRVEASGWLHPSELHCETTLFHLFTPEDVWQCVEGKSNYWMKFNWLRTYWQIGIDKNSIHITITQKQ